MLTIVAQETFKVDESTHRGDEPEADVAGRRRRTAGVHARAHRRARRRNERVIAERLGAGTMLRRPETMEV